MRASATTTPSGSDPTNVIAKIAADSAKPSMSNPISTEKSTETPSLIRLCLGGKIVIDDASARTTLPALSEPVKARVG